MFGKNKIVKFISLLVVLFFVFVLSACSGGIGKEDAQKCAEGFFFATESDDFNTVASLMHPERGANAEYMQAFIEMLESEERIDFSNGTEIKDYTGYSSTFYSSDVNGALYVLDMIVTIDGIDFTSTFEIVQNDNGFGIFNFHIDRN